MQSSAADVLSLLIVFVASVTVFILFCVLCAAVVDIKRKLAETNARLSRIVQLLEWGSQRYSEAMRHEAPPVVKRSDPS
jgi:hypothetical protein